MLKKSSGIAIVFALLVVGAFYYERYQKDHQFEKGGEFAQFLATEAVRDAKENNHVLLDYTPESIRIVESILGGVHDQYAKNPDSVSAHGLGSAYGAYIGEVIRRSENGAKWERDDPVAGEKSYPLHWGGRVSFPMTLVLQAHRQRAGRQCLEQILCFKTACRRCSGEEARVVTRWSCRGTTLCLIRGFCCG